jgi:hypothetical protein
MSLIRISRWTYIHDSLGFYLMYKIRKLEQSYLLIMQSFCIVKNGLILFLIVLYRCLF